MKYTSIYSASSFCKICGFRINAYCLILLLVVLFSCEGDTPEIKRAVDFKAILEETLNNSPIRRYLIPPKSVALFFHFGELPIYNNVYVAKPVFNIAGPNNSVIEYSTRFADEIDNVIIVVDRLIVDHDSATVELSVSKMSLTATFHLRKNSNDKWFIKSTSISQS